jgi:hypothetical protein
VTLLEDAVAQSEAVPFEVSASTNIIRPDRMPARSVAKAAWLDDATLKRLI